MRTDPRKACANREERLLWALVHDGIAHPLMALTLFSGWAVRFHDWTSARAWPRPSKPGFKTLLLATASFGEVTGVSDHLRLNKVPFVVSAIPDPDGTGAMWYEISTLNLAS